MRDRYGPWALVTGASSGIGRGFARELAARGLDVVLVARRRELLEQLALELERDHRVRTCVVVLDLVAPDAALRLADAVADLELGMVVHNAGTGWIGRFTLQAPSEHAALVQLHCALPVELTARLLPAMLLRGRGAIVLVSSAGAYVPLPYYAVYGGTKAFLKLWGEALAEELRGSGVDVLVVAPGDVKTGFQEVAGEQSTRWASVEQVVEASLAALGNRVVVVPDLETRLSLWLIRFLPRALVVRITAARQRGQTPEERR